MRPQLSRGGSQPWSKPADPRGFHTLEHGLGFYTYVSRCMTSGENLIKKTVLSPESSADDIVCAVTRAEKFAPSKMPEATPAIYAAQLRCPRSGGTLTY
mmetsp:Transcript_14569/g.47124  ORF Transcript_14569/g.47124 Transcript_14569/m.47124 type:complete len:99 (+) Transcript_14569:466-762(+)